ncbi:MAG TPA: hypothetical protein VNN10_03950 [Dehalococcoidia bacterium]|nr:hypothetical protein [Dehalococcoidia bacterium]
MPTGAIPLVPIERRDPERYRLFALSSLAFAVLGGFALAIHIPLGRILEWASEGRRPDMVQVHGQVQLLAFAGLFVMGMAMRLMPRFASTSLRLEALVLPVWGLFVASLGARLLVSLWLPSEPRTIVHLATQFGILLGSAGFFLIVYATLLVDTRRLEATAWFFLAGAAFLVLQAGAATFVAIREAPSDERTLPYLPNTAVLFLQLGFVMSFIGGVATRAIPTMSGWRRPEPGAKRAAVALSASVLLAALPLLWLEYEGYSTGVARLADLGLIAFGGSLVAIAGLTGALWPEEQRLRPASQPHMRLVKAALIWMLLAGGYAVYAGAAAFVEGSLPHFDRLDALRHALGAGVIMTLIFGMALMVLPEFAGERQRPNRQRQLSSALLLLALSAAALRVLPSLFGTRIGPDERNFMLLAAGIAGEAGVLLFTVAFARLVFRRRA